MTLSTVIMIIGILLIAISFFMKDSTKKLQQEVEDLSISVFQETNSLKRRLKLVEEELMLEPDFQVKQPKNTLEKQSTINEEKPVHEIIVNQVLALHKQELSIAEISERSNLSEEQVKQLIDMRGGNS